MKLRVGYELQYAFPQPTPAILMLNIHFTRVAGLAAPDNIIVRPSVPISGYRDGFGNWCCRILAPQGKVSISADAVVTDSGLPDPVVLWWLDNGLDRCGGAAGSVVTAAPVGSGGGGQVMRPPAQRIRPAACRSR